MHAPLPFAMPMLKLQPATVLLVPVARSCMCTRWQDNQCNECLQVWNPRTGACTATVDTGYGLSLLWAPGNRHAVVGTKVRM